MKIKGNSGKEGIEHHIHGKIRSGELVSQIERASKAEFVIGKDCYAFLPEMLSELGYGYLREVCDVKRARSGKKKNLEDMASMPPGLRDELLRAELDPKMLGRIGKMLGRSGLSAHGLLHEMDPGKKNSFANWFREGIKTGSIINDKISA